MDGVGEYDDGSAEVFNQLRVTLAARLLATNKLTEAIDLELQTMATAKHLPLEFEQPLTLAAANELANSLTCDAMSIVDVDGRMELRGAGAKSGVQLFPCLPTRAGIAAAVMEYYR